MNHRSESDLEKLYLLTREGFTKSTMAEYRDRKEAASRYMLSAVTLNSESVQSTIRREIRRVSEIMVEPETIDRMLRDEVLKRDTIEGEQAEAATKRVLRCSDKPMRKAQEVGSDDANSGADCEPAAAEA